MTEQVDVWVFALIASVLHGLLWGWLASLAFGTGIGWVFGLANFIGALAWAYRRITNV